MPPKLTKGLLGDAYKHRAKDILSARFMVPPFSVLSTREGWWQQRKRQWIDLGIRSELGRGYEAGTMSYTCGKPGALQDRYAGTDVGTMRNTTLSHKYTDDPRGGLLRPPRVDLRPKVVPGGGGPNSVMHMRGGGGDGRAHKKFMMQGKDGKSLLSYYKGANPTDPRNGDIKGQIAAKFKDAAPGGSPRPAMNHKGRRPGGPIVRGDGRGRPLAQSLRVGLDPGWTERNGADPEARGDPVGGTSVFDPVLCELTYRWFCPPGGAVLDPFAGGSVRGIVAGELGLHYTGIDLSERQLAANLEQAEEIAPAVMPVWHAADSIDVQKIVGDQKFDLLFSCPPYGNLEKYSDDPRDLSAIAPEEFDVKYFDIIQQAAACLRPGAFAAFVVGDYRDKDGFYRDLPGLTIYAFEQAGMRLYNTAILVNVSGSLPLRINAQFLGSRKLGTTHQTVLVFAKGQPREFVKTWPPMEIE